MLWRTVYKYDFVGYYCYGDNCYDDVTYCVWVWLYDVTYCVWVWLSGTTATVTTATMTWCTVYKYDFVCYYCYGDNCYDDVTYCVWVWLYDVTYYVWVWLSASTATVTAATMTWRTVYVWLSATTATVTTATMTWRTVYEYDFVCYYCYSDNCYDDVTYCV